MRYSIETEGLSKRYGAKRGIEGVTLRVPEGVLFGFIGPNGAGKSTTIRTLLGLLAPTAGSARLLGRDVRALGPASREGVGYVAGEASFGDDLTVGEVLRYLGGFHRGSHEARRAALCERFELDPGARAAELSLGNRRKVALVVALQTAPRLLVLDEPTNGLDPVIQSRLFDVLLEEAARGVTVFFSSHVLSEVQRVCRTVAVMHEGRLAAVEDVEALRRRQVRRVRARFERPEEARARLSSLPGVERLAQEPEGALSLLYGGVLAPLLGALAALEPRELTLEEPSLEELFLQRFSSATGARHGS